MSIEPGLNSFAGGGAFLFHAQSLHYAKNTCQAQSLRRATFFIGKPPTAMDMTRPVGAVVSDKLQAWLDLRPRGEQAAMSRATGIDEGILSLFSSGKRRSMRADNLAKLLAYIQSTDPEFYATHFAGLTYPVTAVRDNSSSTDNPGDESNVTVEVDSLRARVAILETENAAMRAVLDGIRVSLASLDAGASTSSARTTAARSPHRRKRH